MNDFRIASPLTNVESILRDGQTVVSKTDLRGNIIYVNQDFCDICGYSEAELMGAPQSIVRHPDMPAVAFKDFWRNLHAGKSWTGLVKNRCKNGNYYWVDASAAPMYEDGKVIGYTSIRTKPSRAAVAAAEAAYKAVRDSGGSLTVRDGKVVPTHRLRLPDLSLRQMMLAMTLALAVLFCLSALGRPALSMACAVLGVSMGVFGAWLFERRVVRPLDAMSRELQRMSAGDLGTTPGASGVPEVARVRQSLRILQINVKLLVGQIKEVTNIVYHGASEMAAGNADLSHRTETQANSLQQTAASIEELTITVQNNAAEAQQAARLAMSSSGIAAQGGNAVGQVMETMGSIRDSSHRIGDIIGVINGIAFQTNILALNAAVEAARAGEQGRGFAVVATEVRNLAQRASAAAKEIADLVGEAVSQAETGAKLVDNAGRTMTEIVSSVDRANEIMSDIGRASGEQSIAFEQVRSAITAMDAVTQQDAALVEQAAAAALSMQQQAHKLDQLVACFNLNERTPVLALQ